MGAKSMMATKSNPSRLSSQTAETGAGTALATALRARFGLSRMEAVVACALADGLTYQEIADRCGISYHTIHSHVKAIHVKARVSTNSRLQALIRRIEAV